MGGVSEDKSNKNTAADGGARVKQNPAVCRVTPKVHTSFRINPVVEVFSKMKGEKENILKEIGLHGLTNLPREDPTSNRSFDWQFAFWLMQHLDSESGSLDLGVRGRLPINCEDVELVLGITCSGVELKKSNTLLIQTTKSQVKEGLLLAPEAELNLDNVLMVLERDITTDKDGVQQKAFVMAAYIYAVSYFLAPKGRPAKVNTEILECILDINEVKNINWASYVLMSLREASAKLRREILAKTKSVTLDGCLLLLQVVYLDNLDFGISSTKHDMIPRIKDFSFDKLRELINSDKKKNVGSGEQFFGIKKLRPDQDSLYTRGDIYRSILVSKQRIAGGLFLDSDKAQVMEYMRKNVDEAKRRVVIASRKFEENATNILDECHNNISALLDVWLEGRVITVGNTSGTEKDHGDENDAKGTQVKGDDGCQRANSSRGRYKTISRRPSKVRKIDTPVNEFNEEPI